MKTIFRCVREIAEKSLAPMTARPLLARGLQLLLAAVLYGAGVWAVVTVSGAARIPVILFAVYFLPAVLRAWLQFYWRLRDDLKSLGGSRQKANKAL